jgi:hypothetical protein
LLVALLVVLLVAVVALVECYQAQDKLLQQLLTQLP